MSYPSEIYADLKRWSESALLLLRQLLPLMGPVAKSERLSSELRTTLAAMLSASARSTESSLLLVAYGQVWDAEILARSVLETTLRFCYLIQSLDQAEARLHEYSEALFQNGLVKDHGKILSLLNLVPNSSDDQWRPLRERLLGEQEMARITSSTDYASRRQMETRWGFTGLVGELARSQDELYRDVGILSHNYAMASHVLHGDSAGVSLPLDRDRRSPNRRDTMTKAHAVRLISDVMTAFQLRLAAGYRLVGLDARTTDAHAQVNALIEGFGPVYDEWMAAEYGLDQ